MPLSVVISSYNCEDLIEDCLKSVKDIADEIIVVDNESSDDTVKVAKKYTKNLYSHKNNPLVLNQAKNYGFTKAKCEWILGLDPDERLSPELAKEISSILNSQFPRPSEALREGGSILNSAYQFPRKNIIFGKWIEHGLWYPDHQIRLFKNGQGKFAEKHNHEKLQVQGEVGELSGHLIHLNYTSVTQYVDKINHMYSDNETKEIIHSGKKVYWYDAIRMPSSDFLTNFFAREAYKDGLHGLVLSLMQAFYTFVVFAKIWEQQGFTVYNSQHFLDECANEATNKQKEFKHWFSQKKPNALRRLRHSLFPNH